MSKASIAIIGLNGFLGKHALNAINSGIFDSKIQFPIKAISRKEGSTSTDKIQYIVSPETSAEDAHLIESIKGVDAIIDLTGASPEASAKVQKLVAKVKPQLFIPSQFGTDIHQADAYAPGFLVSKTQTSEAIRQLGIKVVDIYTSIFAIPGLFLYEMVSPVGIHEDGIHLIGDINQKFNVSKLEDVGNVVLAVATHKPYADLPDTIHVASDTITVKDVISKFESAKGIKLDLVSEKTAEQGKQEFLAKLNAGFNLSDFVFYLQVIIAQGLDKGLYFSQLDNELVNPNESLWKWSKY
ncbi:hypothetical protein CORT_0H01440 [Candida orthopsilosis Co 90-125]|uniref:NmrA-like domain-containing protein n=1 Tax=Candida orthopsilosis (strain 90-125) TaxID=1136231 RepID=H8XB09_CANO9|nr:hypothetical protein CORT_0H01440 [Candida orthopsilosis Co 90-125]CCG25257.1 hypothetical protein CORT_0H01440 [Candida orthopsilosis Co 90-125]